MKLADFSPPSSPSLDQQRDALKKGLGRAMQWVMSRRLDDDPLLAACLRDLRYDVQVEDARGEWLWRMIQASDAADRFRVSILHALYDLSDYRSAYQLCELARHYAEAGDETFRLRLYEIVEQKPVPDSRSLGEEEILQLDGEKAFVFAARVRGETLAGRAWEWDDDVLVAQAIERFGADQVNNLLSNAGDRAIATYLRAWESQEPMIAQQKEDLPYRERMRAIAVDDILSAAESNDASFSFSRYRGWGRCADEAQLETVLEHLWAARKPSVIANLLKVFTSRAMPRFDTRLIGLCQHPDDEVRRRAIIALEQVEHPAIPEFALDELGNGIRGKSVVGLFLRNYRRGDEQRILESVVLPDDDSDLHWLLMDVIKVLEVNPGADCSQLGVISYALTPCENCRHKSARLLHDRDVAPPWLIEECRFDSGEESRELVAAIVRPS